MTHRTESETKLKRMLNFGGETNRQMMVLFMVSCMPFMLKMFEIEAKELVYATYFIGAVTLIIVSLRSILPAILLFIVTTILIIMNFFKVVPGVFITGGLGLSFFSLMVFAIGWSLTGRLHVE